jgi:hypothetical protein
MRRAIAARTTRSRDNDNVGILRAHCGRPQTSKKQQHAADSDLVGTRRVRRCVADPDVNKLPAFPAAAK